MALSVEMRRMIKVYLWCGLAVVFVFSLIYSGFSPTLENMFQRCWVTYDVDKSPTIQKIISNHRGSQYWLNPPSFDDKKLPKNCLITSWAVSHMTFYAILGYMFPSRFAEAFVGGVLFELLEWKLFDCHCILDLMWSSIGFVLGAALSTTFKTT